MANTYVDYTAVASQTDYNFSFEYLRDDHVKVKVDGTLVTNYTIVTAPTPTKIRFNTAPTAGATIKIYRDSRGDFSPLVDFVNGSVLTESELDESYKHNLFVSQESSEGSGGEQLTKKGLTNYDAEDNKIINLGTPTASTDAANKAYTDQTIDNAIALGGSPAIVSLGGYDVTSTNATLKQLRAWTADIEDTSGSTVTATGSTTARSLANRFADVVNVLDYGATGDGVTDDTNAIQAAINSGANHIFIPEGTYLIRRSTSVDGHTNYGLVIDRDDLTISGANAATKLKRYDTDISTYALAYPLVHIGGVEVSNSDTASNIVVKDLDLYGNDTRHSLSGNSLSDFRTPIHVKSAINLEIDSVTFWAIDSSAIYFQAPRFYSYITNDIDRNTNTYSENVKITNCTFWGQPHTTTGRALLHAIVTSGVDDIIISNNLFSWCDDAVNGSSTFDINEIDAPRRSATYTKSGVDYYRTGRNQVITNNVFKNSSEHAVYMETVATTISGNTFSVDNTYCYGDVKIRGQYISITGNTISANGNCVSVAELSRNVTVAGNTMLSNSENSAGIVDVNSEGIKTYVDNRPWFTVDPTDYPRVENIIISDNNLSYPTAFPTGATYGYGIRLYTDASSITEYPDGTLHNVTISNNTVENVKVGVAGLTPICKNIKISGNIFRGGSFTSSGFDGTDLKGYCALMCYDGYIYNIINYEYVNNKSVGFKYVLGILDSAGNPGGGGASYYRPPRVFQNNQIDYALDLSESSAVGYWYPFGKDANNNIGSNLIARNTTLDQQAPNNSIAIVGQADSNKRGNFYYDGTNLRYYNDDSGNFLTL